MFASAWLKLSGEGLNNLLLALKYVAFEFLDGTDLHKSQHDHFSTLVFLLYLLKSQDVSMY